MPRLLEAAAVVGGGGSCDAGGGVGTVAGAVEAMTEAVSDELGELLLLPPDRDPIELVVMLSLRLMDADEEAIILRKFEAIVSDDTNEEAKEEADEATEDWC